VFNLVFGIFYLGRALLVKAMPELAVFRSYWDPEDDFERVLFYCVLGLGGFYLGYYSTAGRVIAQFYPSLRTSFVAWRGRASFWCALVIGIGAYALHAVLLGGMNVFLSSLISARAGMYFGYGWLTPFQTLALIAVPLAYVYWRGARLSTPFVVAGSALVILLLFATLSRGVFLTWLVMIAVHRRYVERRSTLRDIFGYGVVMLTAMVVLWWLRQAPWDVVGEMGKGEVVLLSLSETLNGFDTAAMVLANYPDPNPFYWGQTIFEALLYPLAPRVFWPAKPAPYGGTRITEAIGQFWTSGTHVNAEIIGELYSNFGSLGIVPGMMLHGLVARSLYVHLIEKGRLNVAHVFLYSYLIALVPGWQRLGLGGATYTFLQFVLPALLLLMWVHGGFAARRKAEIGRVSAGSVSWHWRG
jgi:hypothetical protein